MRILFLTPNLRKIGGIEQYNKNLLQALKESKEDVCLVELEKSNLLFKVIFVIEFAIKTLIFRPNITFCGHINFSPLVHFLNKFFSAEYILTCYGKETWNLGSGQIKVFKRAHKIISISGFTADRVINQIPEVKNKIFILHPVADGNKFYPKEKPDYLVKKYNLENKKVIFTLARIDRDERYKGYDKVIKTLPDIIDKVPNAVYILGGYGNDLENVKEVARKAGIKDNVIFTGFIKDEELVDYYNLADVFIMPSKKEGFGIVFLEALSCGIPVIAGNKDGSVDPLQGGEMGVLVNPDNVDEIADSLMKVLNKKIDKKLFDSKHLRNETIKKFSFEKFKEKAIKIINS